MRAKAIKEFAANFAVLKATKMIYRRDQMIIWIKDAKASIFNSSCSVLVNPVNCDGIMGAGLALEFKRRFPAMFENYRKECIRGNLSIGRLLYWRNTNPKKHSVLNFPTKNHWRDHSHLLYIRLGLSEFVNEAASVCIGLGIDSFAFPMLGCGLGGLDRNEVRELMSEYLNELENLRVEIYLR